MFRLGLDIDGCINDFGSLLHRYASVFSEKYGIEKQSDMSDYSVETYFGWSEYINNEFWSKYYKVIMVMALPQPGVAQAISLLRSSGIEIYLITARMEKYRELTTEWLNKYNVQFDSLIMTSEKAKACVKNQIDLMVEDEPENCESIAEYTPVLCMTYKYNEHLEGRKNIIRVSNWDEIYNEVMSCARQGQAV